MLLCLKTMNVIFLNTWHGQLHAELRAYVQHHLPTTSVFCFQEALDDDRSAYEDVLAESFTRYTTIKDLGDGIHYGNTTYVRSDIPVVDVGTIFEDVLDRSGPGLVTYVILEIDGEPLTVCNVHGAPFPGHKLDTPARLVQSKTLLQQFMHAPRTIIGGDFNLLPHARSILMFSEHGMKNLISEYSIPTTRNHHVFDRYPDSIQYHADYAFVTPDLRVDRFIVPDDIVSDHQPLELSVSLVRSPRLVPDQLDKHAYSSL